MESPLLEKLRQFVTRKRVRIALLSLLLMLSGFVLYLDMTVRAQFEGKRWALPARVYARPLELYPGLKLRPEQLGAELAMLGYRDAGGQLDKIADVHRKGPGTRSTSRIKIMKKSLFAATPQNPRGQRLWGGPRVVMQ